ncbi:MAG TPA: TPM domain-containing protein [Kiloniellales bacterium]|nr:TPM domain-containing protein [Kiloniellales bacterium]
MIRTVALAVLVAVAATTAAFFLLRGGEAELVEDGAALMSEDQRDRLAEYHAYLTRDHDIDYRVVTARDLGDINRFAVERFEAIAQTSRSESGRGLLLVIDAARDLVRLEVSYALEGVYPDAFVAYIEQRQMVPFFARGRVADGILAATELIITRAQNAAANAGFETEVWSSASGGAGATAPARLDAGPEPIVPRVEMPAQAPAERTPARTLQAYFAAMQARNADPELGIYTPETRRMLRGWVMTPAQMDNVVRTYRACHAEATRFGPAGRYAVIRYLVAERACAPWFFRRTKDGWALDLTMMQRAVRFGRSNAWHFAPGVAHPYRFAFEDWRFDKHGFPAR